MRRAVKDVLENIVGQEINNQFHAKRLLENKLIELGGGEFAEVADDIPMLIEFIQVFDPSVGEGLDASFWNNFMLGSQPKRIGKMFRPKERKMDADALDNIADAIIKMYDEGKIRHNFTTKGFSLIHENNAVVCTFVDWMHIEGPVREYSCKLVFSHKLGLDKVKSLVPEKYLDGKKLGIKKGVKDVEYVTLQHVTSAELINIFTNQKIVEESC